MWLLALTLRGIAAPPGTLPWHWHAGAAGLLVASYAPLVWILGAGRRAADRITMLRAAVLAAVLAAGDALPAWPRWALLALALLADLLDGAVARRHGPTAAGAVLDMETDQFATVVLAWSACARGVGVHALLLPAMRPLFVLAMRAAGRPAHDPKPVRGDNRRGRCVCALVFVSLLAANCPFVAPAVGDVVAALAAAALAWSFGSDAWHLLVQRRA